MLSTGAFNALLKTLEEPPAHVKFIFATTEPNKIPITVLSRCQRLDFAGIAPGADRRRPWPRSARARASRPTATPCRPSPGGPAARCATPSRCWSSCSSFGGQRLTAERVHQLLGHRRPTSGSSTCSTPWPTATPAAALTLLDEAVAAGVQPADLLDGAARVPPRRDGPGRRRRGRCRWPPRPASGPACEAVAGRWPLDSILAALQILAEARGRLRGSPHGRLLVELALVPRRPARRPAPSSAS